MMPMHPTDAARLAEQEVAARHREATDRRLAASITNELRGAPGTRISRWLSRCHPIERLGHYIHMHNAQQRSQGSCLGNSFECVPNNAGERRV